jgi:SAM-dependent methyltransferase
VTISESRTAGQGESGVVLTLGERSSAPSYWDHVLEEALRAAPIRLWRAYMRGVYKGLMARWLPASGPGPRLKTDLFEEAITPYHLLPELGPRSVGVDGSLAIVQAARERLKREDAHHLLVVADLRALPIRSGVMGQILSGSSLDHFSQKRDIARSLADLARILAPGGILVITLDNMHNPVVWLRNHLPLAWLNRLGLVPYYVGATYSRAEARSQLQAVGLVVTAVTAVAHAPRVFAIWLAALTDRLGSPSLQALVSRVLDGIECLERWPTRYRTGYYLAVRAEKPRSPATERTVGSRTGVKAENGTSGSAHPRTDA